MKFTSKVAEAYGKQGVKSHECFVCTANDAGKGLSLIKCQTAFSRITLGEKLQEILGAKYVVLISAKDSICWDCGMFLNWIDRFEHKIELMKEYFYDNIHTKYKKAEVCLKQESDVIPELPAVPTKLPPSPAPVPAAKHVHFQDAEDVGVKNSVRRPKEFRCSYCRKEYVSPGSLGMHIQKMHFDRAREVCLECDARFDSKTKLKRHMKEVHPPPEKKLTCVSCGFYTVNTEIYCRHVCNSSIVSLTCVSCNKRYVDSNFRNLTGAYKCQACHREEDGEDKMRAESEEESKDVEEPVREEESMRESPVVRHQPEGEENSQEEVEVQEQQEDEDADVDQEILQSPSPQPAASPASEDIGRSELVSGLSEFVIHEESDIHEDERLLKKENQESYLRCEGCSDQFRLRDLTQHPCFIRGDAVEFVEVEAPINMPKIPEPPILACKACGYQFSSIETLRSHWNQTGHLREVDTTGVELNKIKDKFQKTEATFKVVKQNFSIRAVIPGQNDRALESGANYKDMFIRVSDNKTDPIEDFVKKTSNSCGTCGFNFSSPDLLATHQKYKCLTCVTCKICFLDNKLLKKHYLYTGHATKIRARESPPSSPNISLGFRCHRCEKTFPSRFLLRKHFQVHFRGTDRGACQFCLVEFDNKNDIQQHVLEVHGAHLYKCSHCDRTFMSEMFRNRHEAKHKIIECTVCNQKFTSQKSLLLHNETYHHGSTCRLCGKVVEDPISLRKHERQHYFDKELQCNLCNKRFRSKALLLSHSKIHSLDEMKFQCEFCLLGFLSMDALKEHKLTHSTRNKFNCSRCPMTFSSRAHYWMHTKTHDASYPCSVCNRTFRDTSLLAIHRRKHWRVRPYQCAQCSRVFSVPSTLLRHLYVHSQQYPHRCGICKKGFLTRHAYHRHTETVHGVSNSFQPVYRRPNIPSLPLNATDEDLFHAADTLISDDSIMFNEFPNKDMEHSSSDLITNEVVVETTELFDEILH